MDLQFFKFINRETELHSIVFFNFNISFKNLTIYLYQCTEERKRQVSGVHYLHLTQLYLTLMCYIELFINLFIFKDYLSSIF